MQRTWCARRASPLRQPAACHPPCSGEDFIVTHSPPRRSARRARSPHHIGPVPPAARAFVVVGLHDLPIALVDCRGDEQLLEQFRVLVARHPDSASRLDPTILSRRSGSIRSVTSVREAREARPIAPRRASTGAGITGHSSRCTDPASGKRVPHTSSLVNTSTGASQRTSAWNRVSSTVRYARRFVERRRVAIEAVLADIEIEGATNPRCRSRSARGRRC